MNIIHLCYAWYGVLTPATMAATQRMYTLYQQDGVLPTM